MLHLVVTLLHFGLLFWIVGVMTIVLRIYEFRMIWSHRNNFGLSVFEMMILVTGLLAMLIVLIFIGAIVRNEAFRIFEVAAGIACTVFLGSIAYILYLMGSTYLNESWYAWAVKDEPFDDGPIVLGRVIDADLKGCDDAEVSCMLVELDSGEVTAIPVIDEPWGNVSGIVYVSETRARYSDKVKVEVTGFIEVEDEKLFWRNQQR